MDADKTEVLEWLAGLFDESVDDITMETHRRDIFGWDSLGMVMLIAGLDERYGIELSEDQVADLKSVADVVKLIETSVRT